MAEDNPIRLFVALALPVAAREALVAAQVRMRRRAERGRLHARFLESAALHLTLKFLGWMDAEHVAALADAVSAVATQAPIETHVVGLVAFGSVRRARIIAAELDDTAGRIAALAEHFETHAEALGVARESRRFRPHVTLARIKRPGDVSDWIPAAQLDPVETVLDEVVLYRSILRPTGAEYQPLAVARLGVGLISRPG